jgi:hypothetical protein
MSPFAAALRSIGQATNDKKIEMRLNFHTVGSAAIALVGLVSALSAPASASEADPATVMSGSLSNGAGTTVFLLNLGFARRTQRPGVQHIPLRASNFAS